ncbi:unnamed protein product [Phytophthora fragariaefolia]|uniref:Unnamed protein product n=1 Tax=Phytophthora fragariaefolia TaxID=1490495 RepID=A0A9W6X8G2_9STRA|nr:unnamed protein product [Phytophthora fragariaefolia]
MDTRRNSPEGTADQDHPPSSPAPASSSPDVPSSSRSPLSGLRLLSAAASSSDSGAQDHGPASTALHSCVACWEAANAPTVHLDRPGPDLIEIRASIQAIQASLRVVEDSVARDSTIDELREEHSCLQRAHTISRRYATELYLQIESAGATAQAFSQFCQDRHDRLQRRLERANELLALRDADVTNLEERLAHTEDRLQGQKRQRAEAEDLIEQLRHQVHDLQSQIAALSSHPDLGSAPPPALSRRLEARDRELHELNVAHSALQQRCLALEQSEEALSEAASQLRRQTDALNRRVSRLREERDSLQESLRDAQLRRQRVEDMRQMESERVIKRRAELQAQAAHVVSMRASIARLEEQTSQWRATSLENERLLQAAQQAIAEHNQDREALRQDRDSIARNRDSLVQDRDALAQDCEVIVSDYLRLQELYSNAYRRMWAIATAMGQDVQLLAPSSFASYLPASSVTTGRAHKSQRTDAASSAPRDVLDLRPQSPVRKNYPSGDSAQIDDSMSSASDDGNRATPDVPAEIDRPPESSKRLDMSPSSDSESQEMEPEIASQNVSDTTLPEIAGSDRREVVEEKEEEDDDTDDEVLSPLSRSRSSLRRQGSLTPRRRTLQPIIDVDGDGDSSSGSSSGNGGSERSGAGSVRSSPRDHVGGDPAVGDLDGATEADEIDDSPLFPTFVPRRLWIPGVCARLFRQPDIIPCDVYAVSSLRVSVIDVQTLSALLTSVSEWLFPAIDPASHPLPDSYDDLITGATVSALMDTSPWSKLSNGEAPLTFIPAVSGRRLPPNFVQDYLELEERHLQSYWESTHFLPISEAMCSAGPALSTYQATTPASKPSRRRFLTKDVIPALRHRQCDLDILLDPFFLHFPKSRVTKHWFPTLDGGASSLTEAADILDLEEPWRLPFRQNPQDHPAMRIARLRDKFLDPRHVQPPASVAL